MRMTSPGWIHAQEKMQKESEIALPLNLSHFSKLARGWFLSGLDFYCKPA